MYNTCNCVEFGECYSLIVGEKEQINQKLPTLDSLHFAIAQKTNFMDGVSQLTQCPILPGTSFRYIFTASPSGTTYSSCICTRKSYTSLCTVFGFTP